MGFLDHLFKLKPGDEKAGNGEKGGNGEGADTAPDPGAFLHPKYFVPRRSGTLPPAAPNAHAPEPTPLADGPTQEIVLTLGDVLARIPTPLLRAGLHDATRELRFSIDDLSSDIARGRAAVPLSKIAALCPDVFAREIGPDDDSEIRLPLQKLVEQIGLLHHRPAAPAAPPATVLPVLPPAPEAALAKDSQPPDAPVGEIVQPVRPAQIAPDEDRSPPPPSVTPAPAIRFHPPPIVRPVLVQPPPILAAAGHRAEPLVSSDPRPHAEPPPHFPLEALQTVFTTDETLDLAAVCRRTAELPGVRACAIGLRGETALAGDAPDGFDHATLHAAATRLRDVGSLPLGALENVTLHGDQAAISIFTRPGVLLAVLHRELPPGVRERLAAVTSALAR